MNKVRDLALGVWEFVVGEDWRTALGVVCAIALTAVVAELTVAAWLIMPGAVLLLLVISIRRALSSALCRKDA